MTPLTEGQIAAQLDLGRHTTSPIKIASGAVIPEWADHKTARLMFSLSRSHLYALTADGKIKSAVLRKRGAVRGRRIFCCESIRAFLNSNVEGAK
jgi:hypothetical protein